MEGIHFITMHVLIVTEDGKRIICPSWQDHLTGYMKSLIAYRGQETLVIDGTMDHLHLLLNIQPDCRLSELIEEIKSASSIFVRRHELAPSLNWQRSYLSMSCSLAQANSLQRFICKQQVYHEKVTLQQELEDLMDTLETNISMHALQGFLPPPLVMVH